MLHNGEILVETPVSYSLFPAVVALRSTHPANRSRMLSTSPLAGISGIDPRLLHVQYLAHDEHQNFNFLFRLR
jgi:hypothetical protein